MVASAASAASAATAALLYISICLFFTARINNLRFDLKCKTMPRLHEVLNKEKKKNQKKNIQTQIHARVYVVCLCLSKANGKNHETLTQT